MFIWIYNVSNLGIESFQLLWKNTDYEKNK